jgi:hypothetical protein
MRIIACVLLVAGLTMYCPAGEAGKHLFILSGQSNMAGMNSDASFTPAVEKAFGKDNVIVVKKAWSGCPIRIWYKDWKPAPDWKAKEAGEEKILADKRWFWPDLVKAVTNAIQGMEIKTVTFVWMQGESDAMQRHDKVYEESLKGVIRQVESDFGRKDVLVVIGRISDFGVTRLKSPSWMAVRDSQVRLASSNPRYGWIDTDDLNDGVNKDGKVIKDDLHYSAEGYKILGERFANTAIELIRRNK